MLLSIGRKPWQIPTLPVILAVLALIDLRVELRLLFDHVTITSVLAALWGHPLAVAVLATQPSLWRHYQSGRAERERDQPSKSSGPSRP